MSPSNRPGTGRYGRGLVSASFCSIVAFGQPMSVDFLGPHTFGQFGPMVLLTGIIAAAGWWLFQRFGVGAADEAEREVVAPAVAEAMWSDLLEGAALTEAQSAAETESRESTTTA